MASESEYYFQAIAEWLRRILVIMSFCAFGSLLAQYGFYIDESFSEILKRFDFVVIEFYLLQYSIRLALSRKRISYLSSHWFETVLAACILFGSVLAVRFTGVPFFGKFFSSINVTRITQAYLIFTQILIVLTFIPGIIKYNQGFNSLKFHPAKLVIISFFSVIIAGTLLFMLPRATVSRSPISPIDALFTSASAVCVTGLSVMDISSTFGRMGQIIILGLIQIGGIGIVTITTFLALLFGKGMAFRERIVMREMTNTEKLGLITSTLRTIFITMMSVEALGALALMWIWSGEGWTINVLIFNSVFHSVSAFCNAGFSLFPDSLSSYANNIRVIGVISILIIIGGLGFRVISDIIQVPVRFFNKSARIPLKVQTKLVLIVTGLLILAGAAGYLIIEGPRTEASFSSDMIAAFFTSITSRTAGFNIVDTEAISVQYSIVLMVLMFIGASPGSTGGGIKTTTFAVLFNSILSLLAGKKRIVVFKKNIPFAMLNKALIVFTISSIVVVCATFFLTMVEPLEPLDLAFEVVSAFGTVGLSRNITPLLGNSGKLIVILCMFIGRVGILTITIAAVSFKEERARIEYPSENIMVG
jgi:potassium uptake TrkH family protein